MALPLFHLVRHGETTWALTGQHTGLTDIPLTPSGEQQAARLPARLSGIQFAAVFTSPLQRAAKTCELAGFGAIAQKDRDLVEWDYGEFEGKTTAEIRKTHPGWLLFRDGCPGGETLEQISARADRFIAKVRAVGGDCLAFSSGHISRVLCARWLGLPADSGRCFVAATASLHILGYEHNLDEPVLRLWNETSR